MEMGVTLQRLYSTFPDGWPGRGLVLLRVAVSLPLFYWAITDPIADPDLITLAADWLAAACGILAIVGLWTPVAGILISLDEASIAVSQHLAPQGHILIALLGLSLAMLGPGAWSVDARLFGRRVFKA